MDQQEHTNEFFNLINSVHVNLFKYLSLPDLLKMRTSKKIKEVVDTYIKRHRQTLLHLPRNLQPSMYKRRNLLESIRTACVYFGKQPEECNITLNYTIFYDELNTRVTTNPPMKALEAVRESGVKISLNIMFDFRYDVPFINLRSSYISTLKKIVQFLPRTESLHLDFSDRVMENWGNDVINSLSQMTQLTSLSICKMHVTGTELIECLSEMTHLSSFSISEIFIKDLYSHQLGPQLEMVVPRLSKLKLSNSLVGIGVESIIEVLPHIRGILSNLTSLDLSNNGIDRNELYKIVQDISKNCSNLRTLNLSHNEICMHKQGVLPLPPIIPLIQSLNNLEQLSLAGNGLNGICIVELIPSLQMLPLLSNLDLSSNNLDYDAIKLVTEYFPMLKVFKCD